MGQDGHARSMPRLHGLRFHDLRENQRDEYFIGEPAYKYFSKSYVVLDECRHTAGEFCFQRVVFTKNVVKTILGATKPS